MRVVIERVQYAPKNLRVDIPLSLFCEFGHIKFYIFLVVSVQDNDFKAQADTAVAISILCILFLQYKAFLE